MSVGNNAVSLTQGATLVAMAPRGDSIQRGLLIKAAFDIPFQELL